MEKYIKFKKDGTIYSGSIFKVWGEYTEQYACIARDYDGSILFYKDEVEEVDIWEDVEKERKIMEKVLEDRRFAEIKRKELFPYMPDLDVSETEERKMIENENGAIREEKTGKGRFDLIPYIPLLHLAKHYEDGAKKHGERNWEKGLDIDECYNSALRHLAQANYINAKKEYIPGNEETLEYHLRAVVFNVFCILNEIEVI